MWIFPLAVLADKERKAPRGFEFIKELRGVREYRQKSNGLTILLRRDDTAPVVTFMVTYRVGSRNEATGYTGATHLLEHMMFKGTPSYNRDKGTQIAAELQKVGAFFNATTWYDRTNYFEILPSDQLELAVKIEADRMRNSMIRDEDRQSEMTVVRNEFDIGENNPEHVLHHRLFSHAYIAHPYHHATIGWRSDIEGVSTERLREFYDTFYWPNNATVSVIGHFDEEEVFRLLRKYFGAMPASPHPIPEVYTTEPPQQGEVRFKLRRAGELGIVAVAHKIPEALHEDTAALELLTAVLSLGKSSRFYKSIIDRNLGTSQYTHAYKLRDPSLMITRVVLTPGTTHQQVEEEILRAYRAVQEKGVDEGELEIARNQLIADIAYNRDGTYAYARELNEAIASANWEFYVTYVDRLREVRREQLQEVAQKYLVEDQRVVGWFEPLPQEKKAPKTVGAASVPGPSGYFPAVIPAAAGASGRPSVRFAEQVQKHALKNGARLLLMKTGVEEVVSFRGVLRAGEFFLPAGRREVAELTADLLDQGTRRRDKFALAAALERMGAELYFSAGSLHLTIHGRCLRPHLPEVMQIMAEILREPAFAEEEFEKAKKQLVSRLRRRMDHPQSRARNLLLNAIFPAGHPYWDEHLDEQVAEAESITLEEVKAFYQDSFGGAGFSMALAGDLPPEEQVSALFEKSFGDWRGGKPMPEIPPVGPTARTVRRFHMADRPNIEVFYGHAGMPRIGDADYLPLYLGNYILGNSALSSRLGVYIRDTLGLTYSISSSVSTSNLADGYWSLHLAVSPPDLQRAMEATEKLLQEYLQTGPTPAEIADAKKAVIGRFQVANGLNSSALARQLLRVEVEQLGLEYLDTYADRVRAVKDAQVREALQQYIRPDQLTIAMAGGFLEEKKS